MCELGYDRLPDKKNIRIKYKNNRVYNLWIDYVVFILTGYMINTLTHTRNSFTKLCKTIAPAAEVSALLFAGVIALTSAALSIMQFEFLIN